MALAASSPQAVRGIAGLALRVASAVQMYAGSYVGIRGPTHATSQGDCAPFNDEIGMIPAGGFSDNEQLGDLTATPIPKSRWNCQGKIVPSLAVTGASARGDIGKPVYLSDDNTFTLTRPTLGIPVGVIVEYISSTTCDVYLYSFGELCILGLSGAGQSLLVLGVICVEMGAAADLLKGIAAPFHGKILSTYAICLSAPADADVHAVIEVEIGGTNMTGGAMTLDFADTLALKIAGTAITAGNEFREGDLIDIEALASGLVAGTVGDGLYVIYAEVEHLIGL